MRKARISLYLMLALAIVSVADARILKVPEQPYPHIQWAINAASDGDTISVWGPEGVPPPYVYEENVNYLVKNLFTGYQEAGTHRLTWDRTDATGRKLSTGAYFITVDAGEREVLKMIER